jgi:uncharacterized protein (TIGR03066 family)
MRTLRVLGVVVLLAGLGAAASGQDKKPGNEKRILGLWETVKSEEETLPVGSTIEFTDEGKARYAQKKEVTGRKEGVTLDYMIKGDKLTLTFKIGTEFRNQVLTIKDLSDTDLVFVDSERKSAELKRKK